MRTSTTADETVASSRPGRTGGRDLVAEAVADGRRTARAAGRADSRAAGRADSRADLRAADLAWTSSAMNTPDGVATPA
ncbi:hypothetical protein [Micromonospora nigra]|uniref:hypothetical protein n=1 Tax=Micromonospora nigra TaxID=145857 RepID=UPI001586C1F6|nr:hypothetical protein [Micromonospora nigra]